MVDSKSINVEGFHINGQGHWELAEYKNFNDSLNIGSIGVELLMEEVYKDAKIPETGA